MWNRNICGTGQHSNDQQFGPWYWSRKYRWHCQGQHWTMLERPTIWPVIHTDCNAINDCEERILSNLRLQKANMSSKIFRLMKSEISSTMRHGRWVSQTSLMRIASISLQVRVPWSFCPLSISSSSWSIVLVPWATTNALATLWFLIMNHDVLCHCLID